MESSETTIQGLIGEYRTIYNTPDVNFKYISFPVKYNIIIHPQYPLNNNENLIENNLKLNLSSLKLKDSEPDIYVLLSKAEIIVFIIFNILLFIFITIYILLKI